MSIKGIYTTNIGIYVFFICNKPTNVPIFVENIK